jgi:hypothetical protein
MSSVAAAEPETAALVRVYETQVAGVRQLVVDFVRATWLGLGDYHDATIDGFVAALAPVLEGAQQHTAALTDGYLATLESLTRTDAVAPFGVPDDVVSTPALRGVSNDELLRRPALELYTRLARQEPFTQALGRATDRAQSITETNLQLAKTHAARHVLTTKPAVVGYRRSLKGARSCALCIVAATQRYHRGKLMPIHPGCDCGVIPVYRDADPGQVIDPTALPDLHAALAEQFGAYSSGAREIPGVKLEDSADPLAYRDVLVEHTHGEIGPVLGVRGQHFTTEP